MQTRLVAATALVLVAGSAQRPVAAQSRKKAEPQPSRSSLQLITEKDSLWVQSNDFWDGTELLALFYFRTHDVLDLLRGRCPSSPKEPAVPQWEIELAPWLMQVCRRPGAHVYPREGGLQDPAAMMRKIVTRGVPGLVCCSHRTFVESGTPANFQLAKAAGRWKCSEGKLVPLEKIERGPNGFLRCEGRVIWPHSVVP